MCYFHYWVENSEFDGCLCSTISNGQNSRTWLRTHWNHTNLLFQFILTWVLRPRFWSPLQFCKHSNMGLPGIWWKLSDWEASVLVRTFLLEVLNTSQQISDVISCIYEIAMWSSYKEFHLYIKSTELKRPFSIFIHWCDSFQAYQHICLQRWEKGCSLTVWLLCDL